MWRNICSDARLPLVAGFWLLLGPQPRRTDGGSCDLLSPSAVCGPLCRHGQAQASIAAALSSDKIAAFLIC